MDARQRIEHFRMRQSILVNGTSLQDDVCYLLDDICHISWRGVQGLIPTPAGSSPTSIPGESISGITACNSLRLLGRRVDSDDEEPEKQTNP
jgi:hypothetical protein